MKTIGIKAQNTAKINLVRSGRYSVLSTKNVLYSSSPIIISNTFNIDRPSVPKGSWEEEHKITRIRVETQYPWREQANLICYRRTSKKYDRCNCAMIRQCIVFAHLHSSTHKKFDICLWPIATYGERVLSPPQRFERSYLCLHLHHSADPPHLKKNMEPLGSREGHVWYFERSSRATEANNLILDAKNHL